jgi:hypothetical protein
VNGSRPFLFAHLTGLDPWTEKNLTLFTTGSRGLCSGRSRPTAATSRTSSR